MLWWSEWRLLGSIQNIGFGSAKMLYPVGSSITEFTLKIHIKTAIFQYQQVYSKCLCSIASFEAHHLIYIKYFQEAASTGEINPNNWYYIVLFEMMVRYCIIQYKKSRWLPIKNRHPSSALYTYGLCRWGKWTLCTSIQDSPGIQRKCTTKGYHWYVGMWTYQRNSECHVFPGVPKSFHSLVNTSL